MKTPAALSDDLLTIYLNDHLGGATTGRELARRLVSANAGTEFGDALASLASQIESDRDELLSIMERLGRDRDPLKVAAGWAGEKVGRVKPNGRLVGYSPLSRLLELETLSTGVLGKLGLWRALLAAAPDHEELDSQELEHLRGRAEQQLSELADLQARAAELALGTSSEVPRSS